MRIRAGLASCLLLAATALAQDESDFPGRSRDVYVGAVRRGAPTRRFEFDCPKGAVFSARIDGRNVANLIFTMSGQFQDEPYLQFVGRHAFVTRTCGASGPVSVVVSSQLRVDAPYRLRVKWRSKSVFRAHGASPALVGELPFSADAGDSIDCRVLDADPRPWAWHAHEVDGPDGFVVRLSGADHDRFVAPTTGDYVFRYEVSPQRVDRVRASIHVSPGRRRARTVRIGDGWPLDRLAVGTIGASGGQVVAKDGLVAGASLDVPAYLLARDEMLVLGAAAPLVPLDGTTIRAAGPAVCVYGALGDVRVDGLDAEVSVPFDAARAGATPRVFVRRGPSHPNPEETSEFEVDGSVVRLRVADTPFTAQVFGTPDVAAPAALSAGASALAADGASVAARGGTVAVGRPGDDLAAADAGSVRVYDAADLSSPPTILVAPDAAQGDGFGRSVALSADGATLAVGTRLREAVYVYRRDGGAWSFDARLDSPAPGRRDGFGDAVAVDDDVVAVGAPHAGADYLVDAGAVRVYERTAAGWSSPTTLEVPWGLAGSSLALDGGRLVVGSPRASIQHWPGVGQTEWLQTGAVELFERRDSGWLADGVFGPFRAWEDSSDVEDFGRAVAIDGSYVLVGAPRTRAEGEFASGSGAAFLFDVGPTGGGSTRVRLPGPRGYFLDFGASVALADGLAIVGATRNHPYDGPDAGSVSVFVREPGAWWPRRHLLRLATPVDGAAFGGSVALTGTLAVIGAAGVAKDAGTVQTVDLAPLK